MNFVTFKQRCCFVIVTVIILSLGSNCAEDVHEHGHPVPEDFTLKDQFDVEPCSEVKHSFSATNFRAFVNHCRGSGRCVLKKNTTATLWIQFEATETVPELERVIISQVKAGDKAVQMPYGPPVSPCSVITLDASDGTGCVDGGIVAGKYYTYKSSFDVLQSFPSVNDIEVRFILRKKIPKHTKLRLWRNHPGPTVFCLRMQNFDVVDP